MWERTPGPVLDAWYRLRLAGQPRRLRVVLPYTLVGEFQLLFLEELCRRLRADGIEGDFVECGVYKGGSAGILGLQAMASPSRHLWLFDAFAGMPPAGAEDDEASHAIVDAFVGSEENTRRIMRRLGVPAERFTIVRGWVEETLRHFEAPRIALLHVDTDFYSPVAASLAELYPHVQPGGFVVINDYGAFAGARRAVDEFLSSAAPGVQLEPIDDVAAYFRKPA